MMNQISFLNTGTEKVTICMIEPRFLKPKQAEAVFNRSHNSVMEDARAAQAIARVGGSVLISVERLTKYYDSLCGGN